MSGFKDRMKTRWANYQPNKTSLYKAVGYTVFWTLIAGFTVGGWTTQGGAQELAHKARVDYAASICAEKFLASDFTGKRLEDLKKVAGRHQRRSKLSQGDWVMTPAGESDEFVREVTLACGDQLFRSGQGDVAADGKTA